MREMDVSAQGGMSTLEHFCKHKLSPPHFQGSVEVPTILKRWERSPLGVRRGAGTLRIGPRESQDLSGLKIPNYNK